MKINKFIKILIASDFLMISGFGLVAPIFAVFLTEHIQDGSIQVAGFAMTIYLLTKAVLQIPIARFLDKNRGEKDDFIAMIIGSVIISVTPLFYLFSQTAKEIYLIQVLYGIGGALSYPSWLGFFTRHIDQHEEDFEWSVYSSSIEIGGAITAGLGGMLAYSLGFQPLFILVSAISFAGTAVLFLFYNDVSKRTYAKK